MLLSLVGCVIAGLGVIGGAIEGDLATAASVGPLLGISILGLMVGGLLAAVGAFLPAVGPRDRR